VATSRQAWRYSRGMKTWGAAVAALAMLVAGCESSGPKTFTVHGVVLGAVANANDIVAGKSCKYFDQKLSVGDPVVVRGSSNEMLGTGKLASDDMDHYPTCILHFDIKGIPAGQAGYTITAGGYQPLIVTEDDLRQEPVGLLTRGAMDVLTGRTDQIKLSR
jgi:hypothetical protein